MRIASPPVVAMTIALTGLAGWAATCAGGLPQGMQGWWLGFLVVGSVSFGACALVLVGALTGGEWSRTVELKVAARLAPLAALLAAPCLVTAPIVFQLAASAAPVDVKGLWLNTPGLLLRQLAVLAGWSFIGVRLEWLCARRWRAAAALVFYGLAVSVCGVDWVLSPAAPFTNSAQGMLLATTQIAAALSWSALQLLSHPSERQAADLGGLLFTASLGVVYLVFMAFMVAWGGDRPSTAAWWTPRVNAYAPLALAALGAALIATVLLALHGPVGLHRALSWAGALIGLALVLFNLWQVGPSLTRGLTPSAPAAVLAQAALWTAAALLLARRPSFPRAGAPV